MTRTSALRLLNNMPRSLLGDSLEAIKARLSGVQYKPRKSAPVRFKIVLPLLS